ncbi:MAG: outer membrane lipoprotein-sorting protein [bacterium]|nr:outer membrane lipoprotein-sorting protein [bacterium]
MKTNKIILILFLTVLFLLPVSGITVEEIISEIDRNKVSSTQEFRAKMFIKKDNKVLEKEYTGYGQEEGEKFFITFTNAEDLGVKYLKIEDELWIYFPDADDVMKISGHMLRQGMMGSDVSYEDMMDLDKLEEKYDSELLGEETINDSLCYKIKSTAKTDDVTYYSQELWVDKKTFVVLKMDLYAKSGRLLKQIQQFNIQKFDNKYYALNMTIQDMRKKDTLTTMEIIEIKFDIKIPENTFTKQNLYR